MSPAAVSDLARRLEAWTGIDMARGGLMPALQRYVETRAKHLALTAGEFCARINDAAASETRTLLDALTVGHSWFFRDPVQLKALVGLLRPGRPNRVWIAGCASGEEAYSIAMLAKNAGRDVRITATDINSEFLRAADAGIYSAWSVRDVPAALQGHLEQCKAGYRVSDALRTQIHFQRHNVCEPPLTGPWDVVCCRNMLIYFAHGPASETVARFASVLGEEGTLIVGAADLNFDLPGGLEPRSVDGRWLLRRRHAPRTVPAAAALAGHDTAKPFDLAHTLGEVHDRLFAGDTHGVRGLCDKVVANDPLCAEGHWLLGLVHYQRQDYQAALEAMRATLLLAPRFWPAAHYQSLCCDRLGRKDEARAALVNVTLAESLVGSGRALLEQMETLRPDLVRRAEKRLIS